MFNVYWDVWEHYVAVPVGSWLDSRMSNGVDRVNKWMLVGKDFPSIHAAERKLGVSVWDVGGGPFESSV